MIRKPKNAGPSIQIRGLVCLAICTAPMLTFAHKVSGVQTESSAENILALRNLPNKIERTHLFSTTDRALAKSFLKSHDKVRLFQALAVLGAAAENRLYPKESFVDDIVIVALRRPIDEALITVGLMNRLLVVGQPDQQLLKVEDSLLHDASHHRLYTSEDNQFVLAALSSPGSASRALAGEVAVVRQFRSESERNSLLSHFRLLSVNQNKDLKLYWKGIAAIVTGRPLVHRLNRK